MGGQNNSKTINPNQQTNPVDFKSNQQALHYIREAFRNCSTNGYLSKDQFNQALAVLEGLGFKRLRDTPLADRLFVLFDKQGVGRISQTQFSTGINLVISDKHNAIEYTFRAYDVDNDNKISKKEFTQLIQQSWKTAFRLLSEQIDPTMNLRTRDVQQWTVSKISVLNQQTSQIFNKLDSSKKGFIQFPVFKQYVLNSGFNDITAQIDNLTVVIPLNLTNLHV